MSVPGLAGFGGTTEDQARHSLHLHSLLTAAGFPKTTVDLIDFLKSPNNVQQLLTHMDSAQKQCHPCHETEFTAIGSLGHLCPPAKARETPTEPTLPADLGTVPQSYHHITKVMKIGPPRTLHCQVCGDPESTQVMIEAWALKNCGADARTSYLAGNKQLHGFEIDFDKLLLPPPEAEDANAVWEQDSATHRARLTLIGLNLLEHKPGHMRSCFKHAAAKVKDGKTTQRPTCRFGLPAVPCTASAVIVNGKALCSCSGDCTDPDHLKLSAEFSFGDVNTMELRVIRPKGFEFTNNHNMIELAVFRVNTDTNVVLGRPGMV